MTGHDPDHDNVLKELDAALQVEPSRAFADGVRARVNRSRTNTARVWWGLAAAASLGLVTLALWRPSVEPPSVQVPSMVSAAPTQAIAPAVPKKTPESVVVVQRPTPPPSVVRREATVARATVTTVASEPRLEVITNQRTLLRELWARVGTGAMVETAVEATPVTAAEVKPITPIVWDPIVVPPIVVTEVGRVPGSSGTPVIRRMTATKETR